MAGSRAQQAAIAISMKKAGKTPKMKDGGYGFVQNKNEKKEIKKNIKENVKQRVKELNIINPENKIQNRKIGRQVLKEQKRNLRKWGVYELPTESREEPMYFAKKGGSTPAWQRKEGKNPEGGLNAKGVASYRRANPGSKLQTAVTTKPSKLDPDSKDAKRRKSFCARMKGMKKSRTSAKTANDPNSRINKSLRKWNC
jgi:hypothetical protein